MSSVQIMKLAPTAQLPVYGTDGSAGMDLHAHIDRPLKLWPGHRLMVPTGIAIALPPNLEAQVRSRSGLAAKHGVFVLNSPGTIDSDYRGEIKVILFNTDSVETVVINPGDRIAQLVVAPFIRVSWNEVEALPGTDRSSSGFGSTGGFTGSALGVV